MRIEVLGTGPALVMLHGWAMHSGIFSPLVEALADHFALHLVDLPGHGRNRDNPLPLRLPALVDAIAERTPPALWLGWSLGGLVALQAAATRPEQVRGLIMVCASPRFVRSDDWPQGMADDVFTRFGDDLARDYRGTLDRFLMLEAQGSDHMRQELRLLRDQQFAYGEPALSALRDGLVLLQESDLRARLPHLARPSLWLAGRRDRLVSPEAMQAAAALAPASRFHQIEGGGHAPFLTHGPEVAAEITDWAAAVPA